MTDRIKYSVSFRIADDNLDPTEITKILGIAPDISHRKGDPRLSITKKGKVMQYAPFRTGMWSIHSHEEKYEILEHHIKILLDILYPVKDKIAELASRGYKMDIFCGAFLYKGCHTGFDINSDILFQMGEMNIDFGICIYPC